MLLPFHFPLDGAGGEAHSKIYIRKQTSLWLICTTFYGTIPVRYCISGLQLFPMTSQRPLPGRECGREKPCPVAGASHVTDLTQWSLPLLRWGGNCCLMSHLWCSLATVKSPLHDIFFSFLFRRDGIGFTALCHFFDHFSSYHWRIFFSSGVVVSSYFLHRKTCVIF